MSEVNLSDGPWRVRAVSNVNGYTPGNAMYGREDGRAYVQDTRTDHVVTAELFRFPIGWRSAGIDTLPIPERAKALARRAMRQLF